MSTYDHLLTRFQDHILTKERNTMESDIKQPPAGSREERMDVYAHGYQARLQKAIEQDYTALRYVMGDQAFVQLIQTFITSTPATHYNLEHYGLGLPDFLKHLGDDHFEHQVAVLEAAIREVFLMPASAALEPSMLKDEDPAILGNLRLMPRSASKLLTFDYPVNAFVTAFRENKLPARPEAAASFTLVYRHLYDVRRYDFTVPEFMLFYRLAQGMTVAVALEDSVKSGDIEETVLLPNLTLWFQTWISNGMIKNPL